MKQMNTPSKSNLQLSFKFLKTRLLIIMLFSALCAGQRSHAQTGGALNFTNGDYVQLGTSFNSLIFGISDFTVETWFKTSMTDGTLISKRSICNVSNFWNLRISAGKIRWEMMEAGGANLVDLSTPLTYNNNLWHHVAVTRNGSLVKIYMDGYTVVNTNSAALTNLIAPDPIKLGQSACNNFIGELDETRIWTVARTTCEIYETKNYQYNGPESTLKLNAHYNQGIAGGNNAGITTLINSAGNAVTGTLNTFALTGNSSNWVNSTCPAQGYNSLPGYFDTISNCGNYVWGGSTYVNSGNYVHVFTTLQGCDSVVHLNLTINTPPALSVTASSNSICSGSDGTMTVLNATELPYCIPVFIASNNIGNDYISFVNINSLNLASGESSTGYTYFNNSTINANVGSNTMQFIVDNTYDEGLAMWIDFNQDGDFNDVNEYYPFAVLTSGALTGTFIIPSSAISGITRLRVACRRNVVPAANQTCGGYDYGEFEDYKINITGGVANTNILWTPSTYLTSALGETVAINNITSATTYTVTVTDINGCSATATKLINVNPLPTTPIITSTTNSICSGTTMNLTNSPNYCTPTVSGGNITGQHFINLFQLNSSPAINNISGDGIYTYYPNTIGTISAGTPVNILLSHGGTINTSKAVWIDLNQDGDFSDAAEFLLSASSSANSFSGLILIPPTAYNGLTRMRVAVSASASITSSQSCSGFTFGEYEDYNINITGAYNALSWAPSAPLSSGTGNPVQITNQTATTTYTLTVTGTNGCTKTDTHNISFLPSPNVSVTSSANSICNGLPVTLTASGASTYSWSPVVTNGVAFTPTATTTYTVTATGANGCTKTATNTITVLPSPTAELIGATNSVCQGSKAMLTLADYCTPTAFPINLFNSDYSIAHFELGDSITTNFILNKQINNSINLSSVYSNFLDQVANVTAGNTYGFIMAPQGPQPTYFMLLADYNQDGVFDLANEFIGGVTLNPSTNVIGANFTIPTIAKNGTTRLRIIVSSKPFGNDAACYAYDPNNNSIQAYGEFEDYSLNISGGVPSNLTWSPNVSLSGTQGTTVFATPNTTTTYTLTTTGANGCSATSTKSVTVNPTPNINITPSSAGICIGNSLTLTATGATSYLWSNGVSNGVAFSPTTTTTYSVVGTGSFGCKDTAYITIPVDNPPSIPNFTSSAVCIGQSASFDLSSVYCTPVVTNINNGFNYINAFTFNGTGIQNISGQSPTRYEYFSNATANVNAGSTYTFNIGIGGLYSNYNGIWVDYNQDGDFADANEFVWSTNTSSINSVNGSFTIPINASNGITRMRILTMSNYGGSFAGNFCTGIDYGEFEDYNLNISGGVNTYVWQPSNLLVNNIGSKIQTAQLTSNTTYTVTALSTYGCSITTTRTVIVNPANFSVTAESNAAAVCVGQSVQLNTLVTPAPQIDSLLTTTANPNIAQSFATTFNIIATQTVNITGFKTQVISGTHAEVWYKVGGFNLSSPIDSGWIQLGATVPITPAGVNNLTTIPITNYLTIPAGATYGFVVVIVGGLQVNEQTNNYASVYTNNADIAITTGRIGISNGSGVFSFNFFPRVWNGQVMYQKNEIYSYSWAPSNLLNAPLIANPTATVSSTTTYSVVVSNSSGCTNSASVTVNSNGPVLITSASSNTICAGSTTTLSASGASFYFWQPGNLTGSNVTVSPIVNTTYTVVAVSSNGCSVSSTITVSVNQCNTNLSLKLFIEGYYTGANTMTPTLMNQGIGNSSMNVDTITVQLRNASAPYTVVASTKTILKTDGTTIASFASLVPNGNYYIVVKHRNAIETWSANPINLPTISTYDFSTAANKAFGNNQRNIGNGQYAIYSGDINGDENIDLLDLGDVEADITAFNFGYFATDLNGDGNVDLLDGPIVENNINGFIFSSHP